MLYSNAKVSILSAMQKVTAMRPSTLVRQATVLAAYLMQTEGMSFEQVEALMRAKRPLVKLQDRHRLALESWVAGR